MSSVSIGAGFRGQGDEEEVDLRENSQKREEKLKKVASWRPREERRRGVVHRARLC